ncbi:hypothetical protein QR680_013680 [Steinernema hermaphroditum]|uniref:Uncharacterized protein n=1 Tax=Steinernema hermaphroditum TaxID=289476 RepID=A0AA39M1Y0_9BILA|nr:hypothetical protein QR680_013680 [Steinernema hermaphroditum]
MSTLTPRSVVTMVKYKELYSGAIFDEYPTRTFAFCVSAKGRFIYATGTDFSVAFEEGDDERAWRRTHVVFEYDFLLHKSTCFKLEIQPEERDEVVDFYVLDEGRTAVFVVHSLDDHTLSQHLVTFDRKRKFASCTLTRTVAVGSVNDLRIGCGDMGTGYIVVMGNYTDYNSTPIFSLLLAADPTKSARFPTRNINKELAIVNDIVCTADDDLTVWLDGSPMITDDGIYFLLCKECSDHFHFEERFLGVIQFSKDDDGQTKFTPAIQETTVMGSDGHHEIESVNMVAQRGNFAWLSFIDPAEETWWRKGIESIFEFTFNFIGQPFRRYGGRPLTWFMRLYFWLYRFYSNYFLIPTFTSYVLNLKSFTYQPIQYNTNAKQLIEFGSNVFHDVNARGDAVFCEMHRSTNELRMGRYYNPFEPRSLFTLAYDTLQQKPLKVAPSYEKMVKRGLFCTGY